MAGPRILLAGAGGVGTALAWSGSGVLGPEALPPRAADQRDQSFLACYATEIVAKLARSC